MKKIHENHEHFFTITGSDPNLSLLLRSFQYFYSFTNCTERNSEKKFSLAIQIVLYNQKTNHKVYIAYASDWVS